MEVAGAVGGETTKYAIVNIEREIGYIVHFRRNVNNLKNKVEQLTSRISDVQCLIHAAENNNENVRVSVATWLEKARKECTQAAQITSKAEHITSCFMGWCCLRFSLGRRAEKMGSLIQALLDEGDRFGGIVSDPKPIQSLELLSAGDFQAFESRGITRNKIMEALKDDKTKLIGVVGMPGVGKTVLVKAIATQVKRDSIFEEVVVVTVSQNPDLKTIQGAIAKDLDLVLKDDGNISLRARQLSERLKISSKKVLIVLDDIWERVELDEVGIPYKDDGKGCTVLLTTRSHDVCNAMETQKMIPVQVLSDKESWTLFRTKAGDLVDSPEFEQVAADVVKECGGLPLAIVTLGRALRNKEKRIWVYYLSQLKKSIYDGNSPVVSSIRLSYNFLQDETTKLCFLYGCFFPEDYVISTEVLLSYLMGENLLKDIDTLVERRGKVHKVIDTLVSLCLLQRHHTGDDREYVSMHDVVRDVAMLISSEEGHGFRQILSQQWPANELGNCRRLSVLLPDSRGMQPRLPNQITAPHLVTLSLSGHAVTEIPPDFFQETTNISTLDLSGTLIESLPPSLSFLVNLRTLLLRDCNSLKSLSPIERLKKIEILNLEDARLLRFPVEIRGLSNLRLLDLSGTVWYEGLSPEVISSLSMLEELYMGTYTFHMFQDVYPRGDGYDSILQAIGSLNCLNYLELYFSWTEPLSELLSTQWGSLSKEMLYRWENLNKFVIRIKGERAPKLPLAYLPTPVYCERAFHLINVSFPVGNLVKALMRRATFLELRNCSGLENIMKLFGMEKCKEMQYLISNVEELWFTRSNDLVAICDGNVSQQGFFHKLRVLYIGGCSKLIKLTSLPTFSNIRKLDIRVCGQLKNLFPITVVRHLLQLEEIRVLSCESMEMLIVDDSSDQGNGVVAEKDKVILPRLAHLYLYNLRNLQSLCPLGLLVDWPSLNTLTVTRCSNLKRLPFKTDSVPRLARLEVDPEWFNQAEWESCSIQSRLRPLIRYLGPK